MEKRIKVKMRGVEVEKLMEDTSNKNIRIKWCKYLGNEPAELYDDSKIYEYELMFRCSEGTTTKEIKDYIDSFKGIEPKNKKEYIAQIHVYETVHGLYNTNTKNFSLQELKEHFKNIKKKTIWKDTSKKNLKKYLGSLMRKILNSNKIYCKSGKGRNYKNLNKRNYKKEIK